MVIVLLLLLDLLLDWNERGATWPGTLFVASMLCLNEKVAGGFALSVDAAGHDRVVVRIVVGIVYY